MKQTVHIGELIPDLMHNSVGIPTDAEIALSKSDSYRHEYPMVWRHSRGRTTIDSYYLSSALKLTELPGKADEFELPPISEAEWKWRIRDSALAAAERSGVNHRPVLEMCAQFGAAQAKLHVGQVVSNAVDIAKLPLNSIVYSAHPDAVEEFKVWRTCANGLSAMLGTNETRPNGYPVLIHSMPEPKPGTILPLPPVEEKPATLQQLAQISLRAWRVGKVFKQRQSWCGVFENTLTALGIDETTASLVDETMFGPGDELNREQTSHLPEGTLLWHHWRNRTAAAVYVRTDRARNKSRTKRVWGYSDDGEQSHDLMTVVSTPSEATVWRVQGSILQHMPDGVTYTDGGVVMTLNADTRRNLATWCAYIVRSFPVETP